MSYSFTVKADTKDEAGVKVEAEFGKVVASQPIHDRDRQAAQDAAETFIDILKEPSENECVQVHVSGVLSWADVNTFTGANVNVSASIVPKS